MANTDAPSRGWEGEKHVSDQVCGHVTLNQTVTNDMAVSHLCALSAAQKGSDEERKANTAPKMANISGVVFHGFECFDRMLFPELVMTSTGFSRCFLGFMVQS